jgi:cytochrome c-type biogenesis protein CcmH/NrfG
MNPRTEAPRPERFVPRAQWFLALAVLVGLVFAVYWPAIHGEFVWDDRANLLEHQHARSLSLENLRWAFTHSHAGHYQPLTWVSYMVDHAIGGLNPRVYHVTSIVWHAIDAVLFAFVACQLLGAACRSNEASSVRARFVGSIVAAAVFALHPLRVESVSWITERRDVLCSAFFLLSLLAYLRAVRSAATGGRNGSTNKAWYCAALGLFAISMLSKALGMALPIVLLTIDVYPLRRLAERGWTRLIVEKLPFLFISIAGGLLALNAQSSAGALVDTGIHGWLGRITVAFYGIAFYPRAMMVAADWYPLYEVTSAIHPTQPRFALSILAVLATTAALVAMRRRLPALLAVWIAYIALLGPVSGIAQSGIHLVADRYSYLSCLGFALLLGWGVGEWWSRAHGRAVCIGATMIVLGYWSVRSWQQTRVWHDEESLWAHELELGPSTVAYDNLGAEFNRRGDHAAALDHFARALEILPENDYSRNDIVKILIAGDPHAERSVLERTANALQRSLTVLRPDEPGAWYALGLVRASLTQWERASLAFERTTQLQPDSAPAWSKLGLVRSRRGDRQGATEALERALALDPQDARASDMLQALRVEPR